MVQIFFFLRFAIFFYIQFKNTSNFILLSFKLQGAIWKIVSQIFQNRYYFLKHVVLKDVRLSLIVSHIGWTLCMYVNEDTKNDVSVLQVFTKVHVAIQLICSLE